MMIDGMPCPTVGCCRRLDGLQCDLPGESLCPIRRGRRCPMMIHGPGRMMHHFTGEIWDDGLIKLGIAMVEPHQMIVTSQGFLRLHNVGSQQKHLFTGLTRLTSLHCSDLAMLRVHGSWVVGCWELG